MQGKLSILRHTHRSFLTQIPVPRNVVILGKILLDRDDGGETDAMRRYCTALSDCKFE